MVCRSRSDVRGARSPQAVAVRASQRPVLCRNRCRVLGATARGSWRKWRADDRRCGRDFNSTKGFPGMARLPADWLFRPFSQASRARRFLAQPVTGRRLAAVRTVQPRRHSNSATRAKRAAFSPRSLSFCAARVAISLVSAAFWAISRSMLACKIAIEVALPVTSGDCSGTRRGN